MLTLHFAKTVLIPFFVINMAAIVITMRIKRTIRPEFSGNLNILFFCENIIGIFICVALGYISFFVKH
jgi:hypothetical protein